MKKRRSGDASPCRCCMVRSPSRNGSRQRREPRPPSVVSNQSDRRNRECQILHDAPAPSNVLSAHQGPFYLTCQQSSTTFIRMANGGPFEGGGSCAARGEQGEGGVGAVRRAGAPPDRCGIARRADLENLDGCPAGELVQRLCGVFRRRPADDDLESELRFHLERAEEELRGKGWSAEEAARMARVHLGGVPQAMEALRDQRGLPWLDDLRTDVRTRGARPPATPRIHGDDGADAIDRHRRHGCGRHRRERPPLPTPASPRPGRARGVGANWTSTPRTSRTACPIPSTSTTGSAATSSTVWRRTPRRKSCCR